ncbi:type I restriction-modification system specificity subunit [Pseudogulbenkiania sp. NH8B]|uniref:restriction endonuclease subunit S n=1 Tax=Pseudogulbenkiania sp. (strain NH8B) TaxID=748280 RepID=UPI0002279B98|nr:restriction endonuclease subunit S [Pseudogulbenkiania sp. NH8B]BAK75893.1 type I restriction-modification system specificity subunit [Pseudogulbenkiania sp. NH8B]
MSSHLATNLPVGWSSTTLGQVSECILGGTPSTEVRQFWGGDVPWMASGDVHLRRITDVPGRITALGLRSSNATLTSPPAVAVGLAGQGKTRGTVALTLCTLSTNQSIALLKANGSDLRTDYLFHNLDRRYEELRARSSGGGRGGLSKAILEAVPIELPPLGEQQKVAQILDTIDTAIHETETIVTKLKAIKQGLLHDLLTRGIAANGELRPPQAEAPHLYKESPLGWIPKEWDIKQLAELLGDVDPAMRSGPFGSALLKQELVETGLPLLGIDNVHTERFVADYTRFVTPRKFTQLARYAVRPDDLMITIMGTVGRCCLVPEDIGQALSSKHTWTISLNQQAYSPYLAMLQVNYSPWVLGHFARDQQGGTMAAIRSETLRSTRLPAPPREEQRLMEERLRELSKRIDLEVDSLAKRHSEKAGLMDDLLTGRVRVTPLLAEAAQQQGSA